MGGFLKWAKPKEASVCMWKLRCADSHSFSIAIGIFNLGGRGQCWIGMVGDGLG